MMDNKKLLEETLREAAFHGDLEMIKKLYIKGVDVNSKNGVNGWTALHWAAHRNALDVVLYLINIGADKNILNNKGELPYDLTCNKHIQELLGGKVIEKEEKKLPITPNFLGTPPLYLDKAVKRVEQRVSQPEPELVLKLRLAGAEDPYFIEVELQKSELNMEKLMEVCCTELELSPHSVLKFIKLPNTILRKDKDIQRLKDYQEIEVVVKETTTSENHLS